MKTKKTETVVLEDKEIEVETASEEDLRDARAEMLLEEDCGPLALTKDFNDPNYVLYTARVNRPGWIRTLQRMGYEFVSEDELIEGKLREKDATGENRVSIDSAARVELGINKGSEPGVVMKCSREVYEKRQALRAKLNQENLKALKPQNENIEGSIVINGKKY